MASLTHLLWPITLLASRHLDRSSSAGHFKCGLGCFQVVELVFESVFCGVSPFCFISRWFGDSIAGGGVCRGACLSRHGPPKARPAPASSSSRRTRAVQNLLTSARWKIYGFILIYSLFVFIYSVEMFVLGSNLLNSSFIQQ